MWNSRHKELEVENRRKMYRQKKTIANLENTNKTEHWTYQKHDKHKQWTMQTPQNNRWWTWWTQVVRKGKKCLSFKENLSIVYFNQLLVISRESGRFHRITTPRRRKQTACVWFTSQLHRNLWWLNQLINQLIK